MKYLPCKELFGKKANFIIHNDHVYIHYDKKVFNFKNDPTYNQHVIVVGTQHYIRLSKKDDGMFTNSIPEIDNIVPYLMFSQFIDYINFCVTTHKGSTLTLNNFKNFIINESGLGLLWNNHDGFQGRFTATLISIDFGIFTDLAYGEYNYITTFGMDYLLKNEKTMSFIVSSFTEASPQYVI